jgi:hypothetical protein
MVSDALLALLTIMGDFFYGLLPNWSVGPDLYNASTYHGAMHMGPNDSFYGDNFGNSTSASPISGLLTYMYRYNAFFPVYEGLLIINYALSIGVAMSIYRGVIWLVGFVRGSGTST